MNYNLIAVSSALYRQRLMDELAQNSNFISSIIIYIVIYTYRYTIKYLHRRSLLEINSGCLMRGRTSHWAPRIYFNRLPWRVFASFEINFLSTQYIHQPYRARWTFPSRNKVWEHWFLKKLSQHTILVPFALPI